MPRGQTPAVSGPARPPAASAAAHDGRIANRDAPFRPAASGQDMSGV